MNRGAGTRGLWRTAAAETEREIKNVRMRECGNDKKCGLHAVQCCAFEIKRTKLKIKCSNWLFFFCFSFAEGRSELGAEQRG